MNELPDKPFTTKDFSDRGGGIDFLGLRYVNLHIVGNNLIPQLNNVTRDLGMFYLGAWIPWKFKAMCGKKEFTPKNYRLFREKLEVAISWNMRDAAPSAEDYGHTRNRVGVTQDLALPGSLSFKAAKRKEQNSFYAAAIYGPSLRALDLIESYNVFAADGSSLNIATASTDPGTAQICAVVDASLRESAAYEKIASLADASFTQEEVDELGEYGLAPSCFRGPGFDALKPIFQSKLLPTDPKAAGYARTQTTRLILHSLFKCNGSSTAALRNVWYTGLLPDGTPFVLKDESLREMQAHWAYFMARQYQRYAVELFLWCFESALVEGCRSIEDVVSFWLQKSRDAGESIPATFGQLMQVLAGDLLGADDQATSRNWNRTIHGEHEKFEYVADPREDHGCMHALRICAAWFWRMECRQTGVGAQLMNIGGSDRMSMTWFLAWLRERRELPLADFLKDVFSNLIFSQHMRVALSRFDGKAQRLRFVLGDGGIEPTISARKSLGKLNLPWMPDRLDTLVDLLSDIGILIGGSDKVYIGPRAESMRNP